MADIKELSLADLNAEAGANIFTYDAGTSDVKLSLKTLLGINFTGLDDKAAIKAIWQLLTLGQAAQATANADVPDNEQLVAFSTSGVGNFNTETNTLPLAITVRTELTMNSVNIQGQSAD